MLRHLFLFKKLKSVVFNSGIAHYTSCIKPYHAIVLQKKNMEWYEIVILIPVIILGVYLRGKYFDYKKNMYHNDSWKDRNKRS